MSTSCVVNEKTLVIFLYDYVLKTLILVESFLMSLIVQANKNFACVKFLGTGAF